MTLFCHHSQKPLSPLETILKDSTYETIFESFHSYQYFKHFGVDDRQKHIKKTVSFIKTTSVWSGPQLVEQR